MYRIKPSINKFDPIRLSCGIYKERNNIKYALNTKLLFDSMKQKLSRVTSLSFFRLKIMRFG